MRCACLLLIDLGSFFLSCSLSILLFVACEIGTEKRVFKLPCLSLFFILMAFKQIAYSLILLYSRLKDRLFIPNGYIGTGTTRQAFKEEAFQN
jgi:hypothetical protein